MEDMYVLALTAVLKSALTGPEVDLHNAEEQTNYSHTG